jgi:hypothetical protein
VVAAGRWDAEESWIAAQKLAAIRELIRRRPVAGRAAEDGRLPGAWRKDLIEEIALELAITKNAADALIALAWTLEMRLPLTAAAVDAGILNLGKARMIADETAVLSDEDAGKAEELVAGQWTGKTWSQIRAKIARAVVNADPEGAARRRERAEREDARVRFWREHAGTAGLAGYGLPADRALMAHAKIQARARAYRAWGIPGTLDQLRVLAYLDKILDTDSRDQYPQAAAGGSKAGQARDGRDSDGGDDARAGREDAPGDNSRDTPEGLAGDARDSQDNGSRDDDGLDLDGLDLDGLDDGGPEDGGGEPGDGGPGDGGPWDGGDGGPGGGPAGTDGPGGGGAGAGDGLPANVDLTIPMLDLLERARRAAEAHGLGVLDPDLARRLAAAAAKNPRSVFRVIVTDPAGQAIGFGQATRGRRPGTGKPPRPGQETPGGTRDGTTTATFTPAGAGPAGGYGAWTLAIGDLVLTVKLAPIPMGECDHRYESKGYQPSDTLRRLVQIRDGECVLPVCVRHPRGCEWDHGVPWPEGRTCSCNGGMRCGHDHRIKHSPGWTVKQFPGGYHRWTTPSGRSYTKGPREYPI